MSYYLGARNEGSGGLPSPPRWVSLPAALPAGVSPADVFKFAYNLHWDANAQQYEWKLVPRLPFFRSDFNMDGAIVISPGDPLHWPAPITVVWARFLFVSTSLGIGDHYLVRRCPRLSSIELLRSQHHEWIWMSFGRDGVGRPLKGHGEKRPRPLTNGRPDW